MVRNFRILLVALVQLETMLACGHLLLGCASAPPDPPAEAVSPPAPDYAHGARVYRLYCGACHDGGNREAPALDDIEAWDERSFQWDAILQQHTRQGFLDMPPEGGHPHLSETSVNDVLFFMETKIRALDE